MAGYFDRKFSPNGGPAADAGPARWNGHQLPRDPDPTNGTVRVYTKGKWMSWDEWIVSAGRVKHDPDVHVAHEVVRTPNQETRRPRKRGATPPPQNNEVNSDQMDLFSVAE